MSTRGLVAQWARLGPRFLPFADAASPDMPLSRLLRLSLFQVSVGMALVLLVGTLNRVMIVELKVSAAWVALMVALPVLYAPVRALIGFRSDNHRCALGWRRVPFIWMGTLIQFGGLAVMPFALLVLAGAGESSQWPSWLGPAGAGLAFLLVGAGLHTTQTAGLALATDLTPPENHPKVVGLMYVMLLAGSVGSAFVFGAFLADFSPGRLVQVIQASALATMVLNSVSLWKQETRRPNRGAPRQAAEQAPPDFLRAWRHYRATPGTRLRLWAIGLGTLGFGMQDVLLEPYGGQMLGLSVGQTTWLTATLAAGSLLGFGWASRVLSRGACPARMAQSGAALGVPAFAAVLLAAVWGSVPLFVAGVLAIGLGAGLFGHGTLTLTMQSAPSEQAGLALGSWGAVQATSAGVAVVLGGLGKDVVSAAAERGWLGSALGSPATGYAAVYFVELLLLAGTVGVLGLLAARRAPAGVVKPV
ncbi:MAG: PucC family protein [Rubrivivax sp.]|jgi:BCD family chlorophyll transporter-like MFS transporter|nr:PucC family protein [Rubrivivax sp.]